MARTHWKILGLLAVLCTGACSKGDGGETPMPEAPIPTTRRVLVACEGSLGNGNAALSVVPATTDSGSVEDAYRSANNQSIGDILQSITRIGDRLFLCVNNSDKILAVGQADLRLQGVIPVPKPRYIAPVSATRAYVSTLFSNALSVIDPQGGQQTGTVALPYKNPEGLLVAGNRVYVCPFDTACRLLYALDAATGAIAQSFPLAGAAPQEVLQDGAGRLWVLSGNDPQGVAGAWTCINPATGQVVQQLQFAQGIDAIRPAFNKTADTLYWVQVAYDGTVANNGIYRMPVNAASLPATPFVAAQPLQYFWGVGVDPRTGLIYIADPKGFTQRGSVLVYTPQGTFLRSFRTGVGPGHFYFD